MSTSDQPKKAPTDWESVEREYRAGQLSVVEIGRQHGVSHTAINKRAKRDGWSRDLTKAVRQGVRAALVSAEVSDAQARETRRETIGKAIARGADVVLHHRKDIKAGRAIVAVLLEQLHAESGEIPEIEEAIIDETADDGNGRRRAAMLRAVSLPARAGAVRDLATALKSLVPLERQAFNLDEREPGGDADDGPTISGSMDPVEATKIYQEFIKRVKG